MMRDLRDYSLKRHNTFGIEARCRRFLEFSDEGEAVEVARILRESSLPFIIIGGGSNLLLTGDYDGIVVRSAIRGCRFEDGGRMVCGSGETFDDMVAASIEAGYYGMENLSLIPGDVGASAVQNIGAYGVEAKDLVECVWAVEIATGEPCVIDNDACEYAYRQSRFKNDWKNRYLITRVTYRLSRTFTPHLDYGNIRAELEKEGITTPTAQQLRQTIINIRNAKLPDPKVMMTSSKIDQKNVKQYVALARANFSDKEMSSYEQQGRAAIIQSIPELGIMETAQANAAKVLVPMLKEMGYKEENITISFRKHFEAQDIIRFVEL